MPALLESNSMRIDVEGTPAIDGLTLATKGERVLMLGAARALFQAASGARGLVRGAITVLGQPARDALESGAIAGAPLDPPLPAKWTAHHYLVWSARLAGHSKRVAEARAEDAILRMKMNAIARSPLGKAVQHGRRATVIAAALATGAETILLEDPLGALPDDVARHFAKVIIQALSGMRWILFTPRIPLISPLAIEADEAIVIGGSEVLAQGAPAELAAREKVYALRVVSAANAPHAAEEWVRLVQSHGARVELGGSGSQLTVELGDTLSTRGLLELAEAAHAVILELRPLSRAFA